MFTFNMFSVHISSGKHHEKVYFTTMSIFLNIKFIISQNSYSIDALLRPPDEIHRNFYVVGKELKQMFAVLLVLGII